MTKLLILKRFECFQNVILVERQRGLVFIRSVIIQSWILLNFKSFLTQKGFALKA